MKQKENLSAAYIFVGVWRFCAYLFMLLGSLWVIGLMVVTIVLGVAAYNSEADTKEAARQQCALNIENLNNHLARSKEALAAAGRDSEAKVADARQEYERQMTAWRKTVRDLSHNIRTHFETYNKVATRAEEEVKRLPQQYLPELPSLCVSPRDIRSQRDYNACREAAQNISVLIGQYHRGITTPISSAMQEYLTPLRKKVEEYESQISDINSRIDELVRNVESCLRNRRSLLASKRSIPPNRYGVPAGLNLYGSDSPRELSSILDAGDSLPLLAATLTDTAEPLAEGARTNLRHKILQLNDWLPIYSLTYSCSDAEKREIAQHNADIDAQVEELIKEQARLEEERRGQEKLRSEVKAQLRPYQDRLSKLESHERTLLAHVREVTENWSLEQAHSELMTAFAEPFPQQPKLPEELIREEERRMAGMKQAVEEEEKRLPGAIAEEEKSLQNRLQNLSEQEKSLCRSVLLGLSKSPVSPSQIVKQALKEAVDSGKSEVKKHVKENAKEIAKAAVTGGKDGVTEKLGEEVAAVKEKAGQAVFHAIRAIISGVKGAAISMLMAYLKGGLIPCTLTYVMVGLVFWSILVVADYLVCPLVRTTKAQEIAERMKH